MAGSDQRLSTRTRVLVAQEQQLTRQVLVGVLGRTPDVEIVAEAETVEGAWFAARTREIDVIVIDAALGMTDPVAVARLSSFGARVLVVATDPCPKVAELFGAVGAHVVSANGLSLCGFTDTVRRLAALRRAG